MTTKPLSVRDGNANSAARPVASAYTFASAHWVPLLLLLILVGLTTFGINGSSSAAIRDQLGSTFASDPHLIAGTPLMVRADEWSINTPLSILQVRTGMPRIQPLLGAGTDMALSYDVPVSDQWVLFRPQHWGFLALPLTQGFAFHWWLPAVMLIFALWLLTVTLLPDRNMLGLLIGAAAVFSPFFQWWYLAGSFLPEALAVLACALFIRILHMRSRLLLATHFVLMVWTLASFILLLYPPFQIPCALVAVAFCLGYLIFAANRQGWPLLLLRVGAVTGCAAVACVFVLLFVLDHRSAIQAIASSAYPGNRTVATGGYSISRLFSGFLDRQLTEPDAAAAIDVNQSEAASPLLAGLFVVPVLVWLMISGLGRRERPNPVLILLIAILALFLVHLFVPYAELVASLTLLDRVPANRLLLGMGMLADILLIVAAWHLSKNPVLPRRLTLVAFAIPFVVLSMLTLRLYIDDALFVGSLPVAFLLVAAIGAAVMLSVTKRPERGAAVLLGLSFLIAGTVNPLSTGVSTTDDLPIASAVAQIDRADPGGWIMQLDRLAVGGLSEQSIRTYSVVYNYPQTDLWRELDPTGKQFEEYNRYGFAVFSLERGPTRFLGHALDGFYIAIDGCAPFVQTRVKHIIADRALDTGCVRLRHTQLNGVSSFYIYEVTPTRGD